MTAIYACTVLTDLLLLLRPETWSIVVSVCPVIRTLVLVLRKVMKFVVSYAQLSQLSCCTRASPRRFYTLTTSWMRNCVTLKAVCTGLALLNMPF